MSNNQELDRLFYHLIGSLPGNRRPNFYELWDAKTGDVTRVHNGVGCESFIHPVLDLSEDVFGRVAWHLEDGTDRVLELRACHTGQYLGVTGGYIMTAAGLPGINALGITGMAHHDWETIVLAPDMQRLAEMLHKVIDQLYEPIVQPARV